MPIEIKELHIRVAVNAPPSGSAPSAAAGDGKGQGANEKDDIIGECVEQVLNILQSKKDR